mmetsp:Transcript_3677/g.3831  ORF Transcript_3677/g.3831 Transcript_3677/m.3831 type:complete len:222 (-) Transcript_3677:599-1264(-)
MLLSFVCSNQAVGLSIPTSILSVGKSYSKCLQAQPLVTNMVTASGLCVLSDSISQYFERLKEASDIKKGAALISTENVPKYSIYRSFCMSAYGAVVYGWLITYWFKFLNHIVPQEGITFALIIKKVFINQFFMSPILNSMFFTYVTITRDLTSSFDQKMKQVVSKLKRDLLPTIKRSCVYWGIIQFINFSYIRTNYQLLYTNSAFVIWTTYIAYIGFQKLE